MVDVFNFELDEMKQAVESPEVVMPNEVDSFDKFNQWLDEQ